jgi:hypothetical protein
VEAPLRCPILDYSPTYNIHVIHAVVPTVGQIVRGRGIQEIKANKDAFFVSNV